jgi:hypothetical protein
MAVRILTVLSTKSKKQGRPMNPRNFFVELRRRNVCKVAVAYAVLAWLLIQQVFPFFDRKTPFLEYGENEDDPRSSGRTHARSQDSRCP